MFALEHSKTVYWSDLASYGLLIAGLTWALLGLAPRGQQGGLMALGAAGLLAWSLIEYAMHRFVLHGLEPFKSWHARHHERPFALISTPTVLSVSLIAGLVFMPALLVAAAWPAAALTLGVTAGYLAYALCHHGTHHWKPRGSWLAARKRWHAIHHGSLGGSCYGVTSTFWDRMFGTTPGP